MLRPRARLPRGLPLQKRLLGLPPPLAIVKPLAIKVIRLRSAPTRRREEDALDRRRRKRGADRDRCRFCRTSHAAYCSTKACGVNKRSAPLTVGTLASSPAGVAASRCHSGVVAVRT